MRLNIVLRVSNAVLNFTFNKFVDEILETKALNMIALRYTRNLFLRAFCIVYLFAFLSFYIQIPGLYGDNGILPAKSVLENSKHKTFSAKVHYQPTLLWLAPYLGLDTNYALDALSLLGSFLAFSGFVSQKFCTIPLFAGLWSLYFSIYQVGQIFVTRSYDDLLLEAGFLALLVAPLLPNKRRGSKGSPTDSISFWLIKWLLFRFLLTNGLTKFISNCPKWWSLTAFDLLFQSMPLPTPLSWYAHHIPHNLLRLSQIFTNLCEIILPFLFFVPLRSVRITGFVLQILLQICIVLTGNYSFVNLLMVTLLLCLLDDQFFYGRKKPWTKYTVLEKVLNLIIHLGVVYFIYHFFNLSFNGSEVQSKIGFTKSQFDSVISQGLTYTTYFGFASLAFTVLRCLYNVLYDQSNDSKALGLLSAMFYGLAAVALFALSTVPLNSLHSTSNSTVLPELRTSYNRIHKLHIINQYGLFPKMTGLDGRPEIVLEGANNIDGPWKEYNFLYKPGNVNHSLPFVAPHTPRIDWQMHWAVQSNYLQESWLLSLAHRLLNGRPEVLVLLDKNHCPFVTAPPKFIRASLYKYKFSEWSKSGQSSWWTRVRTGEFFPPYSKDSPELVDHLRARNLLPNPPKQTVNPVWKQVLDSIRYVASHLEATLLLWSIFTAGCAIITSSGRK